MIKKVVGFFKTQFMYDARPWLSLALGCYAIRAERHAIVNLMLGAILMICAASIFAMRLNARLQPAPLRTPRPPGQPHHRS